MPLKPTWFAIVPPAPPASEQSLSRPVRHISVDASSQLEHGGTRLNTVSNVFWLDRRGELARGSIQSNLDFDVAIVGAGAVGLQTAHKLCESGLKVAVLEARKIGFQATGRSTGKITSQHGLRYERLIRDFGFDEAKLYADVNEHAKRGIASICASMPDNAQLEAKAAFVYAQDERQTESLIRETNAAVSLGLPAEYLATVDLPMPCAGALRFASQYQFDPYLYLNGLARLIGEDVTIFENSRVFDVVGDGPFQLQLERSVVTARTVVVATQMPIVGPGLFFAKAFPFAHPVAAAPLPEDIVVNGMFISAESPSRSFRTARRDGCTFLVAAGREFKTGDTEAADGAVGDLLAFLKCNFRISKVSHLWINEDFRPMDGVPFVGPASSNKPHLLVATGFDAWGITQGAVASDVLAARVRGETHPAGALFDATRFKPRAGAPTFISENAKTAAHLAGERLLRSRVVPIEDIRPGDAGVIDHAGEQLAVRKARDGTVTAHSAICTHLGCVVGWNATDRTWDCSCHGSRFDGDGVVLSGPAVRPLEKRHLPSKDGAT